MSGWPSLLTALWPAARKRSPLALAEAQPRFRGTCTVCGNVGEFVRNHDSVREGFRCARCEAPLRGQAQASAILSLFAPGCAANIRELVTRPGFSEISLYEPGVTGPFRRRWADKCKYVSSFFWPDVALGECRDGIRCENLECLTFDDESFDLVITSDIFEHVRKPMAGFAEVARVLKPGGAHVFSVPAGLPLRAATFYRVDTSGPEDVHLVEPRYHGDGAGGRSLVYTDFGEDLIPELSRLGMDTEVHVYRPSPELDLAAVTFISRKRADAAAPAARVFEGVRR